MISFLYHSYCKNYIILTEEYITMTIAPDVYTTIAYCSMFTVVLDHCLFKKFRIFSWKLIINTCDMTWLTLNFDFALKCLQQHMESFPLYHIAIVPLYHIAIVTCC